MAQLYLRALGSLLVASYDSQGYGGAILTRLLTGRKDSVNVDFVLLSMPFHLLKVMYLFMTRTIPDRVRCRLVLSTVRLNLTRIKR
jgi:hypothetical protein